MFSFTVRRLIGAAAAVCLAASAVPISLASTPVHAAQVITPIHDVQGSGLASLLVGETVVIQGVVVGDFQDGSAGTFGDDLNGFHVQEEDTDADTDPATSEGIFIFDDDAPNVDVSVGDLVQVEGVVAEFFNLTELREPVITVLSSGNRLPTPANVSLPVDSVDDFEPVEGMRAEFAQPLVISEYFNFDRFGEVVLTSERHLTPTAEFEPGAAAPAAFQLDKITLDDGRSNQNPDLARHPNGADFDLTNLFRGGDTLTDVTGVVDYAFGSYRIQPTQGAVYANANPRTAAPDPVGGSLKVATFNVLNYFTTLDNNGPICGPAENNGCRGADNAEELDRQRAKIVAALVAIDADVLGLIEIENNINDDAVIDLVDSLNAAVGAGTYAAVETGAIGDDAIKVAFLYKPASVSLAGAHALLDGSVDPRFIDSKNRPVLAQTFVDNTGGGIFTVAVNHLKSKGSSCDDVGDPDLDDGSGNCNGTRTDAAAALVDWLAGDPTASGSDKYLVIGDLNSYDKEDPIDAIIAGADDTTSTADDYTDLVRAYLGEDAYSYVFDGKVGYLDHALANAALIDDVTGVTVWHINSDEPDALDYDTSFKKDAQDAIFAPDPYRSSDHDPVIIGLDVCDVIAPTFDQLTVSPEVLSPPNHKYVDVTTTVVASDNSGIAPTVSLLSVTSNEPDNGQGDGNTVDDIVIVDDFNFQLRAERSGQGDGRIYTITYEIADACGNIAVESVFVTVPK
jgi:predicted extracellular nuclease